MAEEEQEAQGVCRLLAASWIDVVTRLALVPDWAPQPSWCLLLARINPIPRNKSTER
jgi:hypothetical protein